jgi:transposase
MGEKSNQIERQIQAERGQLGQNLNELQSKVEEVTNWRAQFQKRPMLMMGVAIGGGLLLASMPNITPEQATRISVERNFRRTRR